MDTPVFSSNKKDSVHVNAIGKSLHHDCTHADSDLLPGGPGIAMMLPSGAVLLIYKTASSPYRDLEWAVNTSTPFSSAHPPQTMRSYIIS